MKKNPKKVLRQIIKSKQTLYGFTNEEMAIRMHMSTRSWCRRLEDVSQMKLKDLFRLEQILHTTFITMEEI